MIDLSLIQSNNINLKLICMKFYSTLVAATLLLVGSSSCKKDHDDHPSVQTETINQKRMVKTNMHGGEFQISYNSDGSIKEFNIPEQSGDNLKTTFTYNGNTVLQTRYLNSKKLWDWVLTLSNGRITQGVHTNFDNQGNISSDYFVKYYYNADGRLSMEEYSFGLREQYDYDADGNLKETRTYEGAVLKKSSQYEYYSDKNEKPMSISLTEALGWGGFRPAFSKNMRKRKTTTNMETQQVSFDAIYTYEFDANGYVLKGKTTNQLNGTSKEWTNVYQ